MNPTGTVATASVTTAAVFLTLDILSHNHVHLSEVDQGYILLLTNAVAHTVAPYVRAALRKLLPNA